MVFGWVDFSDEERRRASEVMNYVRYPGAIDELGFGVLRDAFANKLFPATSTLHTHARYYYLVSYLMKDIERKGAGKSFEELQQMLRDGEMRTARRLVAWTKQNGVSVSGITGSDSLDSGWVKMTPATMDWAAIQRLRIFKDPDMKLRGFLRAVSASAKGGIDLMVPEESSESSAEYSTGSFWNVPFSTYKTWDDGEELPIWLAKDEAEDLRARIKRLFPNTVYACLVDCAAPDELARGLVEPTNYETSFVNLVESQTLQELNCSPVLIELCEAAANLSCFVSLLHIRFNHLLRRRAEVPDFESNAASLRWEQFAYSPDSVYHERTLAFDVDETFKASGVSLHSVRDFETRKFLSEAKAAYLDHDLVLLDALIERREKHLKGAQRSKIVNAKAYAQEWFGGLELTYRLNVALMVASEINMALEVNDD